MYKVIPFASTSTGLRELLFFSPHKYKTIGLRGLTNTRDKHSKVYALSKHWFTKYTDYIKSLQKTLDKSFPKTMHIFRIFGLGTKDFYNDLKQYFAVKKKKSAVGIGNLTIEELQLLHKMPKDITKLTPFLLIAALPFANYVVCPLGYYFPRIFLTSQFWDIKQRLDFALIDHKNRLKHNKPLLRCVQASLKEIEDVDLKNKWNDVIATLGSGRHPTPQDIIDCKILFRETPYSLKTIGRKHVVRTKALTLVTILPLIRIVFQKELLAVHKMTKWLPYRRQRLLDRGLFIQRMDRAIENGGGVTKMASDSLRWVSEASVDRYVHFKCFISFSFIFQALFFRGLNPVNMSTEDMRKWLNTWIIVSSEVDEHCVSLLLHCPILLAYNHETNWTLLHC